MGLPEAPIAANAGRPGVALVVLEGDPQPALALDSEDGPPIGACGALNVWLKEAEGLRHHCALRKTGAAMTVSASL